MNKLKALIQWFIELELQEHRHWCPHYLTEWPGNHPNPCEHRYYAWKCKGVFCGNRERKFCVECVKEKRNAEFATAIQLS